MIESICRSKFQHCCIDPMAKWMIQYTQIKPAQLTLFALIFGVLSPLWLLWSSPGIATIFLMISGYLDILDGSLARLSQSSSATGAVFDIVADRIVEFSVIFGLYCVAPLSRATTSLWMLGSSFICVTSFLVVAIFSDNSSTKSFYYSMGLMERAEAFIFFIAMMLLPGWFMSLAWIYTLLVLLTAFFRVIGFVRSRAIREA